MLRHIVGSIILIFSPLSLYAADKCAINAYEATYSLSLSHGKPVGSIKKSTNVEACKPSPGKCYHIKSELNAHKFILPNFNNFAVTFYNENFAMQKEGS